MDYHVEEEKDLEPTEDDTIDFVPDPAVFARPPRPTPRSTSRGTRRWVIAAAVLTGVALVFAALALQPGPGIARAAPIETVRVLTPGPSDKIDLFVLPPWNDDEPAAKLANMPQD